MSSSITSIFVDNLEEIRTSQSLDNFLPSGFNSLSEVDKFCEELVRAGRLVVVDSPLVRETMLHMKSQDISMNDFRELAKTLHSKLVDEAKRHQLGEEKSKAAISVRAGLSFLTCLEAEVPNLDVGFITQERDEVNPTIVSSLPKKLGSFKKKHAFVFDPMLATGGSMSDVINEVLKRGASEITVVVSFPTPQGVARIALIPEVTRIICPPLEAGLNKQAFIVGGIGDTAMLGDFGDRYFGSVS